jgi:RNA recognition motif-containing protein
MRLFIGNLIFELTERELRDLLSPYGVTDVKIIADPRTGDSRGFAYAEVEDAKAITDLDGTQYRGRKLHIEAAKPIRPAVEVARERALGRNRAGVRIL